MFIQRILLFQFCFCLLLATSLDAFGETKPGCPDKCGNVTIPYPFGITSEGGGGECSIGEVGYGYNVNCDSSYNPPKPFIGTTSLQILSISETEIRVSNRMAKTCFNIHGDEVFNEIEAIVSLQRTPFTFSNTKNKYFLIGCSSLAFYWGYDQDNNESLNTCLSFCDSREKVVEGSCGGMGCCQNPIPNGLKRFRIISGGNNDENTTDFLSYSPCNYAFVGESEHFNFTALDLLAVPEDIAIPIVLDWAIGNQTCEEAQKDPTTYACHGNSLCSNADNNSGYRCTCFGGYKGNPYLSPGCTDINECEDENNNPCDGICINTNGSFNCTCPVDSRGDGRKDGQGCTRNVNVVKRDEFPVLQVTLGIGLGLLFLVIASSWICLIIRKRKSKKMKEKFFQRNGGLLLQQLLSNEEGGAENPKIFTAEELKLATNNYDKSLIVGRGGYGTVYKGTLADNSIVAIKKPKVIDRSQVEFINELVILAQLNHRNMVRLLGCCLETEVPLLVYEYISNGTLFQRIHPNHGEPSLSWANRLRISIETADALAYLHSAASTPIIHGDVKSTNILLDENYTAKVADIGASWLIAPDQTGTSGYLDPDYFNKSQLTEKSDVYSFGVVLVELLTAEMPISQGRPESQSNLAPYFISSMEENKLFQLIDARVRNVGTPKQVIAVAELANRCLSLTGEGRPTMRQVTTELETFRAAENEAWSIQPDHDTKSSVEYEPTDLYSVPVTGSAAGDSGLYSLYTVESGQNSSNKDTILQIGLPR